MDKKPVLVISIVSAVIVIVSLASAIKNANGRKAAESEATSLREQIARMQAYIPNEDADMELIHRSETNEIAALKALLAEKNEQLAALTANEEPEQEEQRPPRESWEDRMARMKEEDPEGYAERIRRRQEFQQEMRYNLAERTATFMDLDTSNMTDEERANHELLVEKMSRIWELTDRFQDPEAAPDREAMREMFSEVRDVRPLMDMERSVMFKQLGKDVGFDGQDAEAFATHISDILDATSIRMPFGGGRGGRGGGR